MRRRTLIGLGVAALALPGAIRPGEAAGQILTDPAPVLGGSLRRVGELLHGLPLSPPPGRLATWLRGPEGQALLHALAAADGVRIAAVRLSPGGTVLLRQPLPGLGAVAGRPVAATGPTAAIWQALGASIRPAGDRVADILEADAGGDAVDGVRAAGFGPGTRIGFVLAPDMRSPPGPIRVDVTGPAGGGELPPLSLDILLAAGPLARPFWQAVIADTDPRIAALAKALAALRPCCTSAACWPPLPGS